MAVGDGRTAMNIRDIQLVYLVKILLDKTSVKLPGLILVDRLVSRYLNIHTYMHACMRTYVRTYVRTYIHTYIHTYILCMNACIHYNSPLSLSVGVSKLQVAILARSYWEMSQVVRID